MKALRRFLAAFAALVLFQSGAIHAGDAAPATAPAPKPEATRSVTARPALWKVADHDTTIYLFGTVHALPDGIGWQGGKLTRALAGSTSLVTELPEVSQGEAVAALLRLGSLDKGQSLPQLMNEEQRKRYFAALRELGLPESAFDTRKPWSVALLLPVVKVLKLGFITQHGVEAQLSERAKQLKIPRTGLETMEEQLSIFDGFSQKEQIDYLMAVIDSMPLIEKQVNTMVGFWAKGDDKALARLLNTEEGDPRFAEALIHNRNRNWARWIKDRLGQPGVVFVAVGAGHLGGRGSVQDLLKRKGIRVKRVQ